MVGEIFDLEQLGQRCSEIDRWHFLFTAPPLPITYAVGSPVKPASGSLTTAPGLGFRINEECLPVFEYFPR